MVLEWEGLCQTREEGEVGMNGNVLIWHVKDGLERIRTWETGWWSSAGERLSAFRYIGAPGAAKLGQQGTWAGRK